MEHPQRFSELLCRSELRHGVEIAVKQRHEVDPEDLAQAGARGV
jgi:hypothetical protein